MKIAHLSDIHFGRIAHPHILDALLRDVEQAGVDLVAVSGDLTQRALPRQFEEAVAYLNKFKMPRIVVPGNHDVYPWWNPYSRLRKPVARYKQFFGDDLFPSFETDNFALFGINSAHGLTIKGGKITPVILRAIKDYFEKKKQQDKLRHQKDLEELKKANPEEYEETVRMEKLTEEFVKTNGKSGGYSREALEAASEARAAKVVAEMEKQNKAQSKNQALPAHNH